MEVKSIQRLIFCLVAEGGRLRLRASAVSTGQEIVEGLARQDVQKMSGNYTKNAYLLDFS